MSFRTCAAARFFMARTASANPVRSATWALNMITSCQSCGTACSIVSDIPPELTQAASDNVGQATANSTPDAKPIFLVLLLRHTCCGTSSCVFPRRKCFCSLAFHTSDAAVDLPSPTVHPQNTMRATIRQTTPTIVALP